MTRWRRSPVERAVAQYIGAALGEPPGVARRLAGRVEKHKVRFRRDLEAALEAGDVSRRWRAIEVTGPMFYRSYGELAADAQPLVMLMAHLGCFVSGLFFLHRYTPPDRPVCAIRGTGDGPRVRRLFDRLGDAGPSVASLGAGAAARGYAMLRRRGVLFAFVDVPEREPWTILGRVSPTLFGAPAALAQGPMRLACLAGARLSFVSVSSPAPARLRIRLAEPLDLSALPRESAHQAAARWAAAELEGIIANAPGEWSNWALLGELWGRARERED